MLRHIAHGTVRDEGVGIATVNASSESAEDASLRRARRFACGEINPSGLRKYGRYVVAAVIAPLAPLGGAMGWGFAGHAIPPCPTSCSRGPRGASSRAPRARPSARASRALQR